MTTSQPWNFFDLKVKGQGFSLIAREVAMELGDGSFSPLDATHLPGVADTVADALSRRFSPRMASSSWQLPAYSDYASETVAPIRARDYYVTM